MSERRLYLVTVEADLYVMAEDQDEAEDIAMGVVGRGDQDLTAFSTEVVARDSVMAPWAGCLPWGDDDSDRTVDQIIAGLRS